MKTFRIPETGVTHYVQGQGVIAPGGTYTAENALAEGDEEVVAAEPEAAPAEGKHGKK